MAQGDKSLPKPSLFNCWGRFSISHYEQELKKSNQRIAELEKQNSRLQVEKNEIKQQSIKLQRQSLESPSPRQRHHSDKPGTNISTISKSSNKHNNTTHTTTHTHAESQSGTINERPSQESSSGAIVPRNAHRLRNRQVSLQKIEKLSNEKSLIMQALRKNAILGQLDPYQLKSILECMRPVTWEPNEIIMKLGEPGDGIYVITQGKVSVNDPKKADVFNLNSPVAFGELSLWYDHPRSATVTAVSDINSGYKITVPEMTTILSRIIQRRGSDKMKLLPIIFEKFNLPHYKIEYISNICVLEEFKKGEAIIQQGTYGDKMYIIDSGSVAVTEKIWQENGGEVNNIIRIMTGEDENGKSTRSEQRVFGMIALFKGFVLHL